MLSMSGCGFSSEGGRKEQVEASLQRKIFWDLLIWMGRIEGELGIQEDASFLNCLMKKEDVPVDKI